MHISKLVTPVIAGIMGLAAPAGAQRPPPEHLCTPTGPGFCTLAIHSVYDPIGHFVSLYDSSCGWLGTLSDTALPSSGTWSFHSKLPYTVELTIDRPDDRLPRGYIWYKGRQTILDQGYRNTCNDNSDFTACLRLAFDCS
ncbi:hypothetical protein MAPG_09254 [Magnaporthiopsis poae ATCC 64411]|uniref:Uncharacterized protein n=1 Tax=Magnaporthiopsis poae (strain ATCC 64411 / 73-15) TaxID=644358 RepID=A0A0C4E9G9_MAGP6|nr:hypothetical protein MAPG_09254 [Magnaporthiopsis poae ATCC 64411]